MIRSLQGLLVILVCVPFLGCGLLGSNRSISKPPGDEGEARKWWDDTIERVDIGSLRCWHQASEKHRQRGSSAMYLSHNYVGQTMAGPYYHDQYFPTPIPAEWMPKVEARLAKESKADDAQRADLVTVETCRNCTKDEAWEFWRRHYKW